MQTNNKLNLQKYNEELKNLKSEEILEWGYEKFGEKFACTTSFGIQSSVLLNMIQNSSLKNKIKIFWIDTGYLPEQTYLYAETLIKKLSLNIIVIQSQFSPARMEAIYGKLWESKEIKKIDKYHQIRKVEPLEQALKNHSIDCWASGVRSQQTQNRSNMKVLDLIRNKFSLRPLLGWTNKDVYYYMEKNSLPNHPLFDKGYTTIGDWHSSQPETLDNQGRNTRFGGIKEECGLHIES